MLEFQTRKKVRNAVYSKGMAVALLALALVVARATWGVYAKERDSAASRARAEAELAKLNERAAALGAELERLRTDEGLEREIRDTYSVAKPGEKVVIIVDQQSSTTSTTTEREGWWGRFRQFFK